MKQIASRLLMFFVSLSLLSCSGNSRSWLENDVTLVPYSPPVADEWRLANGLTVLFMRNPELPMVTATLYTKGGAVWEPQDKPGIAAVTGALMRQGGAGSYSADELDHKIDQLSASISSGIGEELGVFSFDCLTSDLEQVFPIFAQILLHPRFEAERIQLWRGMALEDLRRRKDEAATIADISFTQVLFDGTAYGRIIGESDVKRISAQDLKRTHQQFIRPDGAILVVSGDVERSALEVMVSEHFADWRPRGESFPAPPAITTEVKQAIYFIEQPFEQSTVIIGHRGVPRLTADMLAIDGFNKIFGGVGFSSRLMKRIRTDLGLVYDVSGGIFPGIVAGKNVISLQTKAATTAQAIGESLAILQSMQNDLVSAEELRTMKRISLNSFVFKFDSAQELVQRYALLRLLNYPLDYDVEYIPRVSALSAEDLIQVARNRWDINKLVYIVVGNRTAYNSIVAEREKAHSPLASLRLIKAGFSDRLEANFNE